MSTTSPPPDSTPSAVSPTSNSTPPPSDSPSPPASPPKQPNANSPDTSPPPPPPPAKSPPPQSPPPDVPAAPPPSNVSPVPPTTSTPPVAPTTSPPPPVVSSPPPTNSTSPPPPSDPPQSSPPPPPPSGDSPVSSPPSPMSKPPESSPPPPMTKPPESSPPPPKTKPPESSPPPPTTKPPESSPPPPTTKPPESSTPPPTTKPPESSPPPPSVDPPTSSPPPPSVDPPTNSPPLPTPSSMPPQSSPPPISKPPQNFPPPPASKPPESSPPPPVANPPIISPPPPNSTVKSSPPPPRVSPTTPVLSPSSSPSPPSQVSTPPSGLVSLTGSGQISTGAVVAISAVLGLMMLFSLTGLLVWCVVKRKRKASGFNAGYIMPSPYGGSSPNSDSSFLKAPTSSAPLIGNGSGSAVSSPGLGNSRPWFTYKELYVATSGFSDENILGEGGFGCVYKGCLPDGREVAVKQLKIGGGQGEREFKAEVEIISRIHHRHLVSLVGYCISDSRRLLIYEFVPNDTLYFHLHGKDRPVMDWARRVKVAAGAARGIAYLHEDCHPRIIHRDIKSSNILLGANFEAQVSDFGLAKLAADADTHITTRIMGTFGYMAPEYASSGKLTEKSDVYSFGVVLLEMITGRKPVDTSQPLGDESLVEWARPLLSDALANEQFDSVADPRLENNYVGSEMFRMVEAAAACVRHSAAKRPRMSQVVRALDSVASSDLSNGMKPGQSEVYDTVQQSAEIRLFQRMAFGSQNYSTDFFSQSSMNNN